MFATPCIEVDVAWWARRGAEDANRDRPPLFRHATRNRPRVVAISDEGSAAFESAAEEHEAGIAYLDAYRKAEG